MIATSFGPEDTYALGKTPGRDGEGRGDVFCLNGDLGVGKTVLPRGLPADWGSQSSEQPYLYHCPGV